VYSATFLRLERSFVYLVPVAWFFTAGHDGVTQSSCFKLWRNGVFDVSHTKGHNDGALNNYFAL
jgi:hypothetical protein